MIYKYPGDNKKINKSILISIAAIMLIFAVLVNFYTDYITVKEVGEQFTNVYIKNIFTDKWKRHPGR